MGLHELDGLTRPNSMHRAKDVDSGLACEN